MRFTVLTSTLFGALALAAPLPAAQQIPAYPGLGTGGLNDIIGNSVAAAASAAGVAGDFLGANSKPGLTLPQQIASGLNDIISNSVAAAQAAGVVPPNSAPRRPPPGAY